MPLFTQTLGFIKTNLNVHTSTLTLTHAYEHFGDGKMTMQMWGGEMKQIIDPLHRYH